MILVVAGTRPEYIKIVPVIMELRRRHEDVFFVFTGQHRDLCAPLFEYFHIFPDSNLAIMKENQSLAYITSSILHRIDTSLCETRPEIVIVQGDTSTTFAASLAAFYRKIPVGHVEAGLRSRCKFSPFPEEMNRTLTSRIADYNFAPTAQNRQNLLCEGVSPESIVVTGNTVIDTLKVVADHLKPRREKKILITAHRRENFGEPLARISRAIRRLASEFGDYALVFPVHPNPNVCDVVFEVLRGVPNVHLIKPLGYVDFIKEMASSEIVLSDSGGVQEEAPYFHIPVVVMRRETERQEGVEAGTLLLTGTEEDEIYRAVRRLITDPDFYGRFQRAVNPYGDGTASIKIADHLLSAQRA